MNRILPLSLALALCAACGPYYVGRKPVELEDALMAQVARSSEPAPVPTANPYAAQPGPQLEPQAGVQPGAQPSAGPANQVEAAADPQAAGPNAAAPAPLLAWSGQVVEPDERPLHDIDAGGSTQGTLIEMYAEVNQRVDDLERDNDALRQLLAEYELTLQTRADAVQTFEARAAQLQQQLADERARNLDLEGRLVTAQIRRLEAEKQLLLNVLAAESETTVAGFQPFPRQ